jgi:hypothetical protein
MFVAAFAATLVLVSSNAECSILVSSGQPTFAGDSLSVRYKGFSNNSGVNTATYLGINNVGSGNRTEQGGNNYWSNNPLFDTFSFTYDGSGLLTSTVGTKTTLNYNLASNPSALNAIQLQVRNTGTGTLTLSDLVVNGQAVASSFSAANNQLSYWTLSNFAADLAAGFTITGKISRSDTGTFGGNEGSRVEMNVGYVIPEPGSLLVWGVLGLASVGMTNRRRKS